MSALRLTLTPALAAALAVSTLLAAPALAGHEHIDRYIHQLRFAPDDDDREAAAEALGKLRAVAAIDVLRHAAVYDREDDVRDEARKAVFRIDYRRPDLRTALPAIDQRELTYRLAVDLLYNHDEDNREEAAESLRRLGDPRALAALEIAAIYDHEDDVREEASEAARSIQVRGIHHAAWVYTCRPGHYGHTSNCPRKDAKCNTCGHTPCQCQHNTRPNVQLQPQPYPAPGTNDHRFADPRYEPELRSQIPAGPDNYVDLGAVPNYNYGAAENSGYYYDSPTAVSVPRVYVAPPVQTRVYSSYSYPTTGYVYVTTPSTQVYCDTPRISRKIIRQPYVSIGGAVKYRTYQPRYGSDYHASTRYTRSGYPYTTRGRDARDRDDHKQRHVRRGRDHDRGHDAKRRDHSRRRSSGVQVRVRGSRDRD